MSPDEPASESTEAAATKPTIVEEIVAKALQASNGLDVGGLFHVAGPDDSLASTPSRLERAALWRDLEDLAQRRGLTLRYVEGAVCHFSVHSKP